MPLPLVLHNARVHTMSPRLPRARALLVRSGRIVAVGSDADVREEAGPRYDDVDCGGDLVLPAFVDAHLHLLAFAATIESIDVTPSAVRDIPALLDAIRERARRSRPGAWLRAAGYRETELRERRHPTRWELDRVAPNNPVRLIHGSGHASVFNSSGLALAGITNESEEPAGGQISRRLEDGEPDGLLLEMNHLIEARMPRPSAKQLQGPVAEACRRLNAAGITAAHDLGVHNDAATLALFDELGRDGTLTIELDPALGIAAFLDGQVPRWRGTVKVVVNDLGETLIPAQTELVSWITQIDRGGATAAVHAVSARAVEHALTAFSMALGSHEGAARGHRIEHAAVCPPQLARRIAHLGITVVSNPGFLIAEGGRYLRELPDETLPYLHNPAVLEQAGVSVASGSDAPVSVPDPIAAMRAAMTRRSRDGHTLPGRLLDRERALRLFTSTATAAGRPRGRGVIEAGALADLVRFPADALTSEQATPFGAIRTMRNGVWLSVRG